MSRAPEEDGIDRPKGALYVVATPIGNLADITLRAIEVLKSVDVIAAEDTRVTSRLLAHHDIGKKLIAVHEHNEQRTVARVLDLLAAGSRVALVSDAGTPAFCDPGARVVLAAREAGYTVIPVPGPNAAAAALSASGFPGPQFLFYGFLPPKSGERRRALNELATVPSLQVYYEAPHRLRESIADLNEVLGGERRIVIARELTKLFENIHSGALGDAEAWVAADDNRSRGELVLIVEGARPASNTLTPEVTRVLEILSNELPVRQAAALAARITGARKNDLYTLGLALRDARSAESE
jgi:16S rRNA (cytidine1402-2'-O)-methyltransferase